MSLMQPWWLVLLGPWLALVILVLRQYRPKVHVPFLDLWPREQPQEKQRRGWRPPAWPLVLLLMALLLAIVSLAKPVWRQARPTLPRITIIVDRGVTMLAGDRLTAVAGRASQMLSPLLLPESQVRVLDTLGTDMLVAPAGIENVIRLPATAVDSRERLKSLIAASANDASPVLLLSDLPDAGAGIVQIAPGRPVSNVGIMRASAAHGQCLVEIRNDSDLTAATLKLPAAHQIELPPRGQSRQYALPVASGLVHVQLEVVDDLADDNDWWVLPTESRPAVTVSAGVPEAIRRFATAYAAARPNEGGVRVQIVTPGEPAPDRVAIVAAGEKLVVLPRLVSEHPILHNVQLPARVLASSARPSGDQWTAVLSAGDVILLAVDEQHRRVWVGMALPEDSPEHVLLWTNIVGYLGGVAEQSDRPRLLDPSWKRIEPVAPLEPELNGLRAGLYARGEERAAMCVPAPVLGTVSQNASAEDQLRAMAERASSVPLSPYAWMAAAACIVLAGGGRRGPGRATPVW